MRKSIMALALLGAGLGTGLAAGPAAAQEQPLGWLAGAWCTDAGPQGRSCERWSAMEGGLMLGTGQTVRDGATMSFEFLRIALDGPVAVYHAQPGGAPPVAFREVKRDAMSVTFENAAHDYPQRIRYWREGDVLVAEISLVDGAKAMRWRFRLMR